MNDYQEATHQKGKDFFGGIWAGWPSRVHSDFSAGCRPTKNDCVLSATLNVQRKYFEKPITFSYVDCPEILN